ncbi:MAG: methyltransferase domain-containing protein [Acidimicrobiia bacterium]|nr:methyltransferase domain-containing protein [Acidimicrobiia bacterium]
MAAEPATVCLIDDVFWIILGRAPSVIEAREESRSLTPDSMRTLRLRLLASPEFLQIRDAWREGRDPYADPHRVERGLSSVGTPTEFVSRAYECLLGRPVDAGGLAHYVDAIAGGDTRRQILRALGSSDEFDRHHLELAPQSDVLLHDTQLCELANPAKWDNPEWVSILRSLGLSDDKRSMHRKPYEFAQLVYGCRRLGVLREDAHIVSVGAGHELVLYWLANHVRRVVATDMYEGVWQDVQGREGDPDVLRRPEDYAPFTYRKDHLAFMRMDGRHLEFADGTFDVAYSLSSIEHFGGLPGAAATVHEMSRVLKPGGILALATEYVLSGPPHDETFQPGEIAQLIDQPGLELVQPIDDRVYQRYTYAAIDLYRNPYQTPHMVVRFNDTVFTTVMIFLRRARTDR